MNLIYICSGKEYDAKPDHHAIAHQAVCEAEAECAKRHQQTYTFQQSENNQDIRKGHPSWKYCLSSDLQIKPVQKYRKHQSLGYRNKPGQL